MGFFRWLRSRAAGWSSRKLNRFLGVSSITLVLVLGACSPGPRTAIAQWFQADQSPPASAPSETIITPENSWAFSPEPDQFDPSALLDLRDLNEAMAGESGFIGQSPDGSDFVKGDGTPIRFWAINSYIWEDSPEAMAEQARFLAKRGVNMVRWHGQIPAAAENTQMQDINTEARDQLWQMVAAMKQEGIYTTLSPYYAAAFDIPEHWSLPRDSDSLMGLLFFDETLQAAYKNWLRALLEPVNPHTGMALKDDPAVAIIQLQNEDSLLFWTLSQLQGQDLALLEQKYSDWLTANYGTLDAALQAWDNTRLEEDDPAAGRMGLYPIWNLTQDVNDSAQVQRLADQTQFLTDTMYRFNADMVKFLREDIGAQQLINAGNWKTADPLRLNDAERYSYTAAEVVAVNRYYGGRHEGENSNWAIINGQRFTDPSVLTQPHELPLALKQVAGFPTIITESSWVPPVSHQSEGPFLVSAFQSLTGVDGFYWFAMGEPQWRQPSSANGYLPSIGKWVVGTPEIVGNFPATALMYRQGYLKTGEPVIQEHRSLDQIWRRDIPLISEARTFDPNRDRANAKPTEETAESLQTLGFLVGPVEVTYDAVPDQIPEVDLASFVDFEAQTITSVTEEIVWDYGQGLCTLDSPKAQGVTGFLNRVGPIELSTLTLTSDNTYATILAVPLDDRPLAEADQILVQVGTTARPTGWQQRDIQWQDDDGKTYAGYEITNYGEAPWRLANAQVALTLSNPGITRAVVLDMNGMADQEIPVQVQGEQITVQFPEQAKYLLLQNDAAALKP